MSHKDIEDRSSFMKDVGEMKLLAFWINSDSVYLLNLSSWSEGDIINDNVLAKFVA